MKDGPPDVCSPLTSPELKDEEKFPDPDPDDLWDMEREGRLRLDPLRVLAARLAAEDMMQLNFRRFIVHSWVARRPLLVSSSFMLLQKLMNNPTTDDQDVSPR